jgi:hypothetical protein
MTKNVKMLLGVALVGGVGYYFWKKSQDAAPKASFTKNFKDTPCNCDRGSDTVNGQTIYMCGDGKSLSTDSKGPCKGKR